MNSQPKPDSAPGPDPVGSLCLPDELRKAVEARMRALAGDRFDKLTEAWQTNVRGIVRDELIEHAIERELFGSKRKRLTNAKTGAVKKFVPDLVKLGESLARRRLALDAHVATLPSIEKRPTSLNAYIALKDTVAGRRGETMPYSVGASQRSQDRPSRVESREARERAAATAFELVHGPSVECADCGKRVPRLSRSGSVRKFCSDSCRNLHWRRVHRPESIAAGS